MCAKEYNGEHRPEYFMLQAAAALVPFEAARTLPAIKRFILGMLQAAYIAHHSAGIDGIVAYQDDDAGDDEYESPVHCISYYRCRTGIGMLSAVPVL